MPTVSEVFVDGAAVVKSQVRLWGGGLETDIAGIRASNVTVENHAALLAVTAAQVAVGGRVVVRENSGVYLRADDGATDADLTGSTGVKWYVQKWFDRYRLAHWGIGPASTRAETQAAFEAMMTKAGDEGVMDTSGMTLLMEKTLTEILPQRLTWIATGTVIGGGIIRCGVDQQIIGPLVLDYDLGPGAECWLAYGLFRCGMAAREDVTFRGPWPLCVLAGGINGGQVVGAKLLLRGEDFGVAFALAESDSAMLLHSTSVKPAGTLGSISAAGSGYTPGRWIAMATSSRVGASQVPIYLVVSDAGVVTFARPLWPGNGNVQGDTLTFVAAEAQKLESEKASARVHMTGGTGFVWTVGQVQGDTAPEGEWVNSNTFQLAFARGQFTPVFMRGVSQLNFEKIYLEACHSVGPYLRIAGNNVQVAWLELFTNSGSGATNNSPGADQQLVELSGQNIRLVDGRVTHSEFTLAELQAAQGVASTDDRRWNVLVSGADSYTDLGHVDWSGSGFNTRGRASTLKSMHFDGDVTMGSGTVLIDSGVSTAGAGMTLTRPKTAVSDGDLIGAVNFQNQDSQGPGGASARLAGVADGNAGKTAIELQVGTSSARVTSLRAEDDRVTMNVDVYRGADKLLSTPQPAIANAASGTEVATINAVLTALRAHGLIAT